MPVEPTSSEERRAGRAHRQRQVRRRRRIAAVSALAVFVVAGGGAVKAWSDSGGQPARVAASDSPRQHAAEQPARTALSSSIARSRLGSGKPVTLAFGGDVHFESPIRERLSASPASVLAAMAPVLRRADVAMVNLETAVTDGGTPAMKEYVFRAPASAFSALASAGVDVATVANNHGMDYGVAGLRDTLRAARGSGVRVVGAGRNDTQAYAPYRVTVNGQRIAIIGATQVLDDNLVSAWTAGPGKMGLASAKDVARLVRSVREARSTSDTVVVFVHWGVELAGCPTEAQTSLANALVGAGADAVVGSHAHVLLGAGRKGSALVDYGLGNFVFYANGDQTTRTGVLEITLTGRRVDGYRWVPGRISGGLPYPLSGSARADAIRTWKSLRACTDLRP